MQLAEVMGGKNVTPKDDIVETEQDKQALDKAKKKRKKFNFEMLDIKPGTILQFLKDKSITCEVYNSNQVKFRDKITSLSNSADIVLSEMDYDWGSVHGPAYWLYNDKTLYELRTEKE